MIDVHNLVYEYSGKRALINISFTVNEGDITALVGPNGAGKTTLLRCIAALEEPFSGEILIAGIDVNKHPRRVHEEIGYLSDFFGLYNELTVRQSLLFMAHIHRISGTDAQRQMEWASHQLGLDPYLDRKAATLSRGWRQRLGIAQAIIHRPRLLLLDEPASGLDPEARIELSSLLKNLRDQGMTLMVSSHILAELEDYSTGILILREGQIIEHRRSTATAEKHCIEVTFLAAAHGVAERFKSLPMVTDVQEAGKTIRFVFSGDEAARARILRELVEGGVPVSGFASRRLSLQDIYMSFTPERKPQ